MADRFDVRSYGATGNGTTDDTAAIGAAYSALSAAGGGTLYFPPGIYAISSTLTLGNGGTSASTLSRISVEGAGAGSATAIQFGGQAPPQVLAAPNTSRILWIGASGANNAVVKIPGAIDTFSMRDIEIDGKGAAGLGLVVFSLSGSQFNNVLLRNCTQAHLWLNSNGYLVGASNNTFTNLGIVTTVNCGATAGIAFGGVPNDITILNGQAGGDPPNTGPTFAWGCQHNVFNDASVWVGHSTGAVAVDLRDGDNNTFFGGSLGGDAAAVQMSQNPNRTAFPGPYNFIGMNLAANDPANTFKNRGAFTFAAGLWPCLVWPFGNNGFPIPAAQWINGMTVAGQTFGPTMNTGASLLMVSRGGSSSVVNTTAETAFTGMPYSLPAGSVVDDTIGAQNGFMLRVKAEGNYSTTGSPTLRLRMYLGGVFVCDTGAVTCVAGASNAQWTFEADLVTNSSANTLSISPKFNIDNFIRVGITQAAAIGLSAGGALTFTATWGTASPSNTAKLLFFTVELLKSQAFS